MCRPVTDATCVGSRRKTQKRVYALRRLPVKVITGSIVSLLPFYCHIINTNVGAAYWHVWGRRGLLWYKRRNVDDSYRGSTLAHTHHWPKLWQAMWVGDTISSMWPMYVQGLCWVIVSCLLIDFNTTVEALVSWTRCVCGQNAPVQSWLWKWEGVGDRIRRKGCCIRFKS